ncbi:MAG: 1-acyl-sn-glycerol-3-phosphate acyltransferase [Bacteroidales bacterium]|nr:1-acyl-sn-glycerol-3-phosphate acyltransferase [Bacteroidales bacterium]
MKIARFLLHKIGWQYKVNVPDTPKCVICVAPHTSNWDFFVGELAVRSVGWKPGFLMKSTWFFFPLGMMLKAIGGVPVHRGKKKDGKSSITESLVEAYAKADSLAIAVTPEGTRSLNKEWHKGMLVVATEAKVPLILAYIDFKNKIACLDKVFTPTGDLDADLGTIRRYYKDKGYMARYPEKFSTGL